MNRLTCAALVLAAAALAAGSVEGAQPRGTREPATPDHELMVSECKLTDQQQADLKVKVKARDDALAAWNTANADRLRAAEEAAKTARSGTDDAAKKKAAADLRAIQTERASAVAQADAAIVALLTAEQKAAWNALQLYQATLARYRKAAPSEEQAAKIKAACAAAAKELPDAAADDRDAKRTRAEVTGKLHWAVEVVILTPEQREAVAKKPAAGAAK